LSTIATLLGLSENLAGVTFLAFGNGSPDVFSTFAAMSSNSGSLALGELIGAAGFITAVVAGSMAFVQPFKVARKSFVRDVSFFIIATSFTLGFLWDGKLYIWESATMVVLYILYVILVVTWHWWIMRRKRKRLIEAAARSHYIIPGSEAEELGEQYHDEEEVRDVRDMGPSRTTIGEDFGALEATGSEEDDADEDFRERFLGEINSNMRLSRPKPGERRNTLNPIRPSLVGALEFRSVLAGLRKSRNIQSYQLYPRRFSADPTMGLSHDHISAVLEPHQLAELLESNQSSNRPDLHRTASGNRARAVSAIEPGAASSLMVPRIDLLGPLVDNEQSVHEERTIQRQHDVQVLPSPTISISPPPSERRSREPSPSAQVLDHLAPPDSASGRSADQIKPALSRKLQSTLKVSTSGLQPAGSGHLPIFTSDSLFASPMSSRDPSPQPPRRQETASNQHIPIVDVGVEEQISRPIQWWPHSILPAPQILLSTLFPTLCSWSEKTWWERSLGIVAAPSVFLLTITLPVVELQREQDSSNDLQNLSPSATVNSEPLVGSRVRAGESPFSGNIRLVEGPNESESQLPSQDLAKALGTHGTSSRARASSERLQFPPLVPSPEPRSTPRRDSMQFAERVPLSDDWNRWLVVLQIFTAPFFIVVIVWANMFSDDPHWLLRPSLISLTVSLALLGLILATTSPHRTPHWHAALCFLGFVVSIAWISTIAGEVVGVLKALGVILNISDAILGLTIFAVGNSLGDLVADITVAKLGFPVMALSACFGGPMLNILLGVGLSGMYMTMSGAQERHAKHPKKNFKYKPFLVDVDRTLMVSGVALLVTLVGLLVVVPLRGWRMDRVVGWGLIFLWIVATAGNIGLEVWLSKDASSSR
jgi:solute carrier family 24 (sodium/potassium/calcium exchanger), member 6